MSNKKRKQKPKVVVRVRWTRASSDRFIYARVETGPQSGTVRDFGSRKVALAWIKDNTVNLQTDVVQIVSVTGDVVTKEDVEVRNAKAVFGSRMSPKY